MPSLFAPLIDSLHTLSTTVPLPLFTALGAAIEEIIAPIPSPLVMTLSGSLAAAASHAGPYLLYLAIVGALAKTAASYLVYLISDLAEDIVMQRFGRLLGVSHQEVEKFGSQFRGGSRDWLVMLALRAIPIIPTAPVSVIAGLLKLKLPMYLWTTLIGYAVRNYFYLYLGATSVDALESLNQGLSSLENIGYVILFVLLLALTYYFYRKRRDENILVKLLRFLHLR